ncbi:MAG: hypothetical protein M9887_07825 [Chitinophagales bacterium]|nr:hypothetical protein [Chitinophagales bacterium]
MRKYFVFLILSISVFSGAFVSCDNFKSDVDNIDTGSIVFDLDGIKVLFPAVDKWEEKDAITYTKDSAIVRDYQGEILLSKTFTVNADIVKTLRVQHQFKTSLSVVTMDRDNKLKELNRYNSIWKDIPINDKNQFIKEAYTQEEIDQYPDMSVQDVLDEIFYEDRTTQSQFNWENYLKQARSVHEFPFQIRIASVTIKLTGTYIDNKPFTKYIYFIVKD